MSIIKDIQEIIERNLVPSLGGVKNDVEYTKEKINNVIETINNMSEKIDNMSEKMNKDNLEIKQRLVRVETILTEQTKEPQSPYGWQSPGFLKEES